MEYNCVDYRAEMILLGLKRRLHLEELSEEERKEIILKIKNSKHKQGLIEKCNQYLQSWR